MNLVFKGKYKFSTHGLALLAMGIYIVFSTVFEATETLSFLNKISLYTFLFLGGIHILHKRSVAINYYWIAVFFYFVIITISFYYSPVSSAIFNMYYYRYFTIVIMSLIAINIIQDFTDVKFVINAFIISGFVLAIAIYFTYGLEILKFVSNQRIGGEFGNVNSIGINLAFAIIFSIYFMYHQQTKEKIIYILVITICLPILLFTGSKKAILIVILAIIMLSALYDSQGNGFKKILNIAIGFLMIFGIYYMINNLLVFNLVADRIDQLIATLFSTSSSVSDSDLNRMYYIQVGIDYFKQKPILGGGLYYSEHVFGTYSHNNYVEILMNTGIIGFLTYYSFYFITLVKLFKIDKSSDLNKIKGLFLTIMLVVMFMEIALVSYMDRYLHLMFAMIVSYLLIYEKQMKYKYD